MGRQQLQQAADRFQPDAVHTPYGPAYVRFRVPHLLGAMSPWIAHPTWMAYRTLSFPWEWATKYLEGQYRSLWFRRADAW